jgi:putative flippase GtrA
MRLPAILGRSKFLSSGLRSNLLRQIWRFILAGMFNTALGLIIIFSLIYLGVDALLANFIGYGLGLIIAFQINRLWTFSGQKSVRPSIALFGVAVIISYFLNLLAVITLLHVTRLGPYLSQLGGVLVYALAMFILCRMLVFKPMRH